MYSDSSPSQEVSCGAYDWSRATQRTIDLAITSGLFLAPGRVLLDMEAEFRLRAAVASFAAGRKLGVGYRFPKNSFQGVAGRVSAGVAECSDDHCCLFELLGVVSLDDVNDVKAPRVAKLCFQVTPLHSLVILEETASASFLNSLGS